MLCHRLGLGHLRLCACHPACPRDQKPHLNNNRSLIGAIGMRRRESEATVPKPDSRNDVKLVAWRLSRPKAAGRPWPLASSTEAPMAKHVARRRRPAGDGVVAEPAAEADEHHRRRFLVLPFRVEK